MHTIWIAYGSNQGDPIAQLLRARQNLATHLDERGASALYRTLLAYDDLHLDHPRLTLPHPGVCERAFVLRPLADLNPELRLGGQTVRAHLARCQDANIQPVAHPDWQTATSGDNHAP